MEEGRGSPEPAGAADWIVLDPYVRCSWRRRHKYEEEDITASKVGRTCTGFPVRASLRVADPPAVSRLYLHCPPQWPADLPEVRYPDVIAAHRGCILFVAAVPFEEPGFNVDGHYPLDYFIYSASPSSQPLLTRLPPCFVGGFTDPEEDELYQPYHQQRQRYMCSRDVGLLCRDGDGEDGRSLFTVAHLTSSGSKEVELCVVQSGEAEEWSITPLRVRRAMSKLGLNLGEWRTDAVLPLHDRFLCWVDYYQGILLIDVLNPGDEPHQFSFIPLPKPVRDGSTRLFSQSYCADPVRCVCVRGSSDSGFFIKLVCVTIAATADKDVYPPAFTITAWTLVSIDQKTWELDFTMEAAEFWDLCANSVGHTCALPRAVPTFSHLNLVDPGVVSFLLMEKIDDEFLFWIVELDMTNKVLRSLPTLYIQVEEEEDDDEIKKVQEVQGPSRCKAYKRVFHGEYFFPSHFTSYLRKNPIQRFDMCPFCLVSTGYFVFVFQHEGNTLSATESNDAEGKARERNAKETSECNARDSSIILLNIYET
uniref:DUF1618 domain-containing protein n=1 Tax=Oryza barthii TaxID=65489 RepID=A0A0D3HW81_9ORYZ